MDARTMACVGYRLTSTTPQKYTAVAL